MSVKQIGLGLDRAHKKEVKRTIKGFSLKAFRRFLTVLCRWCIAASGKEILFLTLNADDCTNAEASKRFSRFTDALKYWTKNQVYGMYRKEYQPTTKRLHFHVLLISAKPWENGERKQLASRTEKFWNELNQGLAMSLPERHKFHGSSVDAQYTETNIGAATYLLKTGEMEDEETKTHGTAMSNDRKTSFYGKVNARLYELMVPSIPELPKGIEGQLRDDWEKLPALIEDLKKNVSPQPKPKRPLEAINLDSPFGIEYSQSTELEEHIYDEMQALNKTSLLDTHHRNCTMLNDTEFPDVACF